jgi:ABC-2 type transport system ATP-binding protein
VSGPAVAVAKLTKRFGDRVAVSDLSFTVAPGEVLGLVGPNGAGKTTTLNCLVGITRPTTGSIRIAGADLLEQPVAAKRALAFVPDEPHFFDQLTVVEHLRFTGRLYGVEDIDARLPGALERMELADRADAFPDELSRGMKQKLAIGCALIHDPAVLILDEPLTGLDPGAIRRMKRMVVERAQSGVAVLLSSHLLHLVEELCDRILLIQNGRPVAEGSIRDIMASRPDLEGRGLEEMFIALTETPAPEPHDTTQPAPRDNT